MNYHDARTYLKTHSLAAACTVALNALLIVAVAQLFDGQPARSAGLAAAAIAVSSVTAAVA